MKVLFASSEVSPFAATGGLGEVCAALPRALHRKGLETIRILPLYRQAVEGRSHIEDTGIRLKIPVGFNVYIAEIFLSQEGGLPTYFIRRDEYFDRSGLYGPRDRDYDDNFERFVFFQKSVIGLMDALQWKPDILHCNDWATGLLPMFLRHGVQGMGRVADGTRTVMTIHNLAYQGLFDASEFALTHLPFSCFSIQTMEFFGRINCLKAGITTSEAVTTVSRTYARETLESANGFGLDGVLRAQGDRYTGIQNGAEYEIWNPATDTLIPRTYSAGDLSGKRACKTSLLSGFGRTGDNGSAPMVVGIISRLVEQKGLDILSDAMPLLMKMPIQFVLLGSGPHRHEAECLEWQRRWPDRFGLHLGYDETLAHRIQSGADVLLMPSKFEPSGLSQLYAMKYGTVPVVHAVGGLEDTVTDYTASPENGTGFKFASYTAADLVHAMSRALELFQNRTEWTRLQKRIMKLDYSWDQSAQAYISIYQKILQAAPRELSRT